MFKPPKGDVIILIDIKCPMCGITERVKIKKYNIEESKNKLDVDFDLHWAVIIDNKLKDNVDV